MSEAVTNPAVIPVTPLAELKENALSETEEAAAAAAKELQQQKIQMIYNNFATPLIGTFLNLPRDPVVLKCPACGIRDISVVQNDLKWWATEINRIFGCLFVTCCCCCCFNYYIPCKQTDRSHYCKNCGCYFGRSMKYKPIKPKNKK